MEAVSGKASFLIFLLLGGIVLVMFHTDKEDWKKFSIACLAVILLSFPIGLLLYSKTTYFYVAFALLLLTYAALILLIASLLKKIDNQPTKSRLRIITLIILLLFAALMSHDFVWILFGENSIVNIDQAISMIAIVFATFSLVLNVAEDIRLSKKAAADEHELEKKVIAIIADLKERGEI